MATSVTRVLVAATVLIGLAAGDEALGKVSCEEAALSIQMWLVVLMIAPTLLNLTSVILLFFSSSLIWKLDKVVESITQNTQWLIKTAARVSLGPTAKRVVTDYAKTKPEFQHLR